MGGIFSLEGGLFTTMGKIFDLMYLSLLWLVFSLPIVTAGASTTALYYTTAKVIRRDRGYIFGEFWSCFKSNFVTSTIYSVIIIALYFIFKFNFTVINTTDNTMMTMLFYVYWLLVYMLYSCGVYLFPVLSRFKNTRVQLVKMSMLLSMKHLPSTIVIQVIVLAAGLTMWIIPLTTCFVPALAALLVSLVMEKVFRHYMPKPEEGVLEEDLEWYMTF